MKTSAETDQIFAALVEAQGEYPVVPKSRTARVKPKSGAQEYSYDYADLGDAVEAVKPVNKKHGLAVIQMPGVKIINEVVRDTLTTRVVHKSGQWFEGWLRLPAGEAPAPQAYGSVLTYLKRYAYCAALGIVADTDDDGSLAQAAFGEGPKSRRRGAPRSSTPTRGGRSGPATDAATDGQTGSTSRGRNKIIAALARREKPVRGDEAVLAWVNEALDRGDDPLPGIAKMTEAEERRLFAILEIDGAGPPEAPAGDNPPAQAPAGPGGAKSAASEASGDGDPGPTPPEEGKGFIADAAEIEGVPEGILSDTISKMATWSTADVDRLIRDWQVPKVAGDKPNQRKTRLTYFFAKQRAGGNKDVEALF